MSVWSEFSDKLAAVESERQNDKKTCCEALKTFFNGFVDYTGIAPRAVAYWRPERDQILFGHTIDGTFVAEDFTVRSGIALGNNHEVMFAVVVSRFGDDFNFQALGKNYTLDPKFEGVESVWSSILDDVIEQKRTKSW